MTTKTEPEHRKYGKHCTNRSRVDITDSDWTKLYCLQDFLDKYGQTGDLADMLFGYEYQLLDAEQRIKELEDQLSKETGMTIMDRLIDELTMPQCALLGCCKTTRYFNDHMRTWNRGVLDELEALGLVELKFYKGHGIGGADATYATLTPLGSAVLKKVQNG